MDLLDWSRLIVVGATLPGRPEGVPLRLRPILKHNDSGELFYLYDEEEPTQIVPLIREDLTVEVEAGRAIEFIHPEAAKPGYQLIQLHAHQQPLYRPAEEARDILEQAGTDEIRKVEESLACNDREAARRSANYAANALHDDPLPHLALVALLRGRLDEDDLWLYESVLDHFDLRVIKERWGSARATGLMNVALLISNDPDLERRFELLPRWLPSHRDRQPPSYVWRRAACQI